MAALYSYIFLHVFVLLYVHFWCLKSERAFKLANDDHDHQNIKEIVVVRENELRMRVGGLGRE